MNPAFRSPSIFGRGRAGRTPPKTENAALAKTFLVAGLALDPERGGTAGPAGRLKVRPPTPGDEEADMSSQDPAISYVLAGRSQARATSAVPAFLVLIIFGVGLALAYGAYVAGSNLTALLIAIAGLVVAVVAGAAVKVATQWDRAVVLRFGRFRALRGPGLFAIVPIMDTVTTWIDIRVITSTFKAEKTLTKDTVPVDVDAVLFWKVVDPQKAAIDVADYQSAINWAAQTALRDVIGKTVLADMLEGRDKISDVLRRIIDARTEPWGVQVISVELKDVLIPPGLENAMSMQAQAERERQARVILGDSERQIADKFKAAALIYADDPTAFHLRAMNMLYEGLKTNSTIVVVPSAAIESMQLGGLAGLTALGLTGRPDEPPREPPH
jgi:regulator of protease activity HflC (stomatin/prohibitin superfamily)